MFFLVVLLLIPILLLVVMSFEILFFNKSGKTDIPIPQSLVGSNSRSRSSFPQSFLYVKDGISLLLIVSSSLPNSLLGKQFCV